MPAMDLRLPRALLLAWVSRSAKFEAGDNWRNIVDKIR